MLCVHFRHLSVYHASTDGLIVEGTRVYYYCKAGYILKGENVRACEDGIWSGAAPRCAKSRVQGCSPPNHILHGDYTILSNNNTRTEDTTTATMISDGSKVFYACHTGYRLKDGDESSNIVCRSGQWQGLVPSCGEYQKR